MSSLVDLFLVPDETGLHSLMLGKPFEGLCNPLLFENCVAAARAPAIAATRLWDLFGSDEIGGLLEEEEDPSGFGFREDGSRCGPGRGNSTGSGDVTGVRPLTAASYTFLSKL